MPQPLPFLDDERIVQLLEERVRALKPAPRLQDAWSPSIHRFGGFISLGMSV